MCLLVFFSFIPPLFWCEKTIFYFFEWEQKKRVVYLLLHCRCVEVETSKNLYVNRDFFLDSFTFSLSVSSTGSVCVLVVVRISVLVVFSDNQRWEIVFSKSKNKNKNIKEWKNWLLCTVDCWSYDWRVFVHRLFLRFL